MQIADKTVVKIDYTVRNSDGVLIDTSEEREPLAYLHGFNNIIPGLEQSLTGKAEGDKFTVSVEPANAYGERNDELVKVVPKQAFQGVDKIEAGMQFQAESPQGPQMITVSKVEGDDVTVDGNHPLAGQTLKFEVEVMEVREASEDEIAHGHAHGPEGH